jgi:DedD protein
MALLDKAYKQRMVGALVLVALAVIFLPMLFSRQDEQRQVTVEAPSAPQAPAVPQVQLEPVAVPEPQALPQEPVPSDDEVAEQSAPSMPIAAAPAPAPTPAPAAKPVAPAPVAKPAPAPAQPIAAAAAKPDTTQSRVDANGLSVSWSVQLASLSSREGAEKLQKTLRSQGYNAYPFRRWQESGVRRAADRACRGRSPAGCVEPSAEPQGFCGALSARARLGSIDSIEMH